MNCEQVRKHWHLFHDSEGDAELHHRINEHLGMCADCARWFHQQTHLENVLVETLCLGGPTDAIWDRIHSRSCTTEVVRTRRYSFWNRAVLLAVSLLIAVGGIVWLVSRRGADADASPHLAAISASLHEKLVGGREPIAFSNGSDAEVDRYLRQHAGFPVHCPPRKDVDFEVAGAGVCTVNERPAAYIVGKVGPAPVSLIVLERKSLDAFPHDRQLLTQQGGRHRCREGRYEMVSGIAAENVVVVVGAVPTDTLERLLNAYGSYHES